MCARPTLHSPFSVPQRASSISESRGTGKCSVETSQKGWSFAPAGFSASNSDRLGRLSPDLGYSWAPPLGEPRFCDQSEVFVLVERPFFFSAFCLTTSLLAFGRNSFHVDGNFHPRRNNVAFPGVSLPETTGFVGTASESRAVPNRKAGPGGFADRSLISKGRIREQPSAAARKAVFSYDLSAAPVS